MRRHRGWIWIKRALFGRVDEQDLDDEIRFHLSEETQLRTGRGETPDTAERRARRAFGNVIRTKEETRSIWASTVAMQVAQDASTSWTATASGRFGDRCGSSLAVTLH